MAVTLRVASIMSDGFWHTDPMRRVAWWLALLSLIPIALVVGARATGVENGPLALLVAFTPWMTLACIVPLVLALLARGWWLVGLAAALAAVCIAWQVPLFTGGSGAEPSLTVASVNMTLGGADADAVVALVRDNKVDVLVLSELTPDAVDHLTSAGLARDLRYHEAFPEPGVPGTGLWSRYPLTHASDVPGFTAHAVEAVVASPGGPITVFAVHPQAPGKHNHLNWTADLSRLHDVLATVDGPVLVAGDFNTTRDHAGFRAIEGLGYADAADQAGSGFAPTFPENRELFALVAIDHVVERDAALVAVRTQTVVLSNADHRALVAFYAATP